MLTNREIAKLFQLLAKMMELHGENAFRVRAYRNAYDAVKKLETPLSAMTPEEIRQVKGIGTSTGEKIVELLHSGRMKKFEEYAAKTPEGIRELLSIKGLGPGKVRAVWKEMGIESPGELLYACHENRLVELSGFGLKTQAEITKQLTYYLESSGKWLWAALEPVARDILQRIKENFTGRVEWVGRFARKEPVVESLEGIIEGHTDTVGALEKAGLAVTTEGDRLTCDGFVLPLIFHSSTPADFNLDRIKLSAEEAFLNACIAEGIAIDETVLAAVPPEMMHTGVPLSLIASGKFEDIIQESDIRGVLHCHSVYSDGLHTLREMAESVRDSGYEYLGISDHSRSAVYANGLSEERVVSQWKEIDALNTELAPFHIFRGIESDILADGSLDYIEEVLSGFDFIIASIHSGLRMDIQKATMRLISAIEHPHTRILGHPTGRLLLARQGYPIDHKKVIDACAENGVAIEINSNPQRLDLDSTWIPYAQDRGVMIAINPDAHSRDSIGNVRYGVHAARRGGLLKAMCLNGLTADEFKAWLSGS